MNNRSCWVFQTRIGRFFDWPRCCSSVKARCGDSPCVMPSGQPKSLAAPSAPIYEMTSISINSELNSLALERFDCEPMGISGFPR